MGIVQSMLSLDVEANEGYCNCGRRIRGAAGQLRASGVISLRTPLELGEYTECVCGEVYQLLWVKQVVDSDSDPFASNGGR